MQASSRFRALLRTLKPPPNSAAAASKAHLPLWHLVFPIVVSIPSRVWLIAGTGRRRVVDSAHAPPLDAE